MKGNECLKCGAFLVTCFFLCCLGAMWPGAKWSTLRLRHWPCVEPPALCGVGISLFAPQVSPSEVCVYLCCPVDFDMISSCHSMIHSDKRHQATLSGNLWRDTGFDDLGQATCGWIAHWRSAPHGGSGAGASYRCCFPRRMMSRRLRQD